MSDQSEHRLELENSLRYALERNELKLYYQPVVSLKTGEITGAEALIRWQHPTFGLVSPADFIPIAEETKLIVPMGEWILRTACQQNQKWRAAGFYPLLIAVNISSLQFQDPNLTTVVDRILQDTQMGPAQLEIELTEGVVLRNVDESMAAFRALKGMGLKFAFDDFGTGFASLSTIKKFPVDTLKIDKSFVRDICTDPDDAAITKTIIAMAHGLKLEVIAEGVETRDQLDFLRAENCDKMQGFLFSKAIPGDDFTQLLIKERLEHSAKRILGLAS